MKNIGVLFGSKTPEHDVSIITGQTIISGLKKIGYNVIPIYLSKEGEWYIDEKLGTIKFFVTDDYQDLLKKIDKYYIDLEKSRRKIVFKNKKILGKEIVVEIAFPAFHGVNGEDGTMQGLFEIFNLPYVGCGVTSSAIAMDKIFTKQLYTSNGIPTAKFMNFNNNDWKKHKKDLLKKINDTLTYPLFVKPARLGSSIGIAKIKKNEELELAVEVALHYDSRILVEEGVNNLKDLTCCVIGNNDLIASEIQEASFGDEFFSYDEKYLNDGGAQLGNAKKNIIIPAGIDPATTDQIKNLSFDVYKLLDCSGIARIDFLYDDIEKKLFVNEVNTLPGTLYHHLWKASNIEFDELLKRLIGYAEEKYKEKESVKYHFESILLKMTKSIKLQQKIN
jgi:D-alanine-D-alanine ligase